MCLGDCDKVSELFDGFFIAYGFFWILLCGGKSFKDSRMSFRNKLMMSFVFLGFSGVVKEAAKKEIDQLKSIYVGINEL